MYLKKAGVSSRNIKLKLKITLPCIGSRLKKYLLWNWDWRTLYTLNIVVTVTPCSLVLVVPIWGRVFFLLLFQFTFNVLRYRWMQFCPCFSMRPDLWEYSWKLQVLLSGRIQPCKWFSLWRYCNDFGHVKKIYLTKK